MPMTISHYYMTRFFGLFALLFAVPAFAVTPMVAAGYGDTLVLKSDGTVAAWGDNSKGQLGNGDTHYRLSPEAVPEFTGVAALSAGREHSLALKSDGTVWAWGENYPNGQLGDGTLKPQLKPVTVPELKGIAAIAAGGWHSLAITAEGGVSAWGKNVSGQLGDGTKVARSTPVSVPGLSGVHAIAAGDNHSLALLSDGTVWAWGDNAHGQLGDGSGVDRLSPVRVQGLEGVTAIVAAGNQSLALKADGTVCAWGTQVSPAKAKTWDSPIPLRVHGLDAITVIVAGGDFALALKADHTVWAWGETAHGQLNGKTGEKAGVPKQVAGLPASVVDIAAGGAHGLALLADGKLFSWGWDYSGQLGRGSWSAKGAGPVKAVPDFDAGSSLMNAEQTLVFGKVPPLVVGLSTNLPVQASSGLAANLSSLSPDTCRIEGGKLKGRAKGECIIAADQPGNGHYRAAERVTLSLVVGKGSQAVSLAEPPLVIVGSQARLMAVSSSGLAPVFSSMTPTVCKVSGDILSGLDEGVCTVSANQPGNDGYNPATPVKQSMRIHDTIFIMPRMAAGGAFSLFLKYDGTATVWGDNSQGQLGVGGTGAEDSQTRLSGLKNVLVASTGMYHSVAALFSKDGDGVAWAWGDNSKGQLGNGDNKSHDKPVQVKGLSGIRTVMAGGWHSLAVKADGTVWSWGMNNDGQLGDGSTLDRNLPVQVAGLGDVKAVAGGYDFSLALKNDGSVWAWGNNAHGQLGDGTTTNRNTPVQVNGLQNVLHVAAGGAFALAATADGKVWAWGMNDHGQLGNGSLDESHVPVEVPGVAKPLQLAAGGKHALALLGGGAVMGWGDNTYGQLGDGTIKTSLVAVPVQKVKGVIAVAAGDSHSVALQDDGVKLSWGYNGGGQLGRATDEALVTYAVPGVVPEHLGWNVIPWAWEKIKELPKQVAAIQKLFAAPPLPPIPPPPPVPQAPALPAAK